MKSHLKLLACCAFALGVFSAQAYSATAPEGAQLACRDRPVLPEGRPRIGLALGGGGARGVAHISVLRKIEEMRIPVDCIAGTSMGALVGAMYAAGMPIDEIEKTVLDLDWSQMFDDNLARSERSYRRKTDDFLVVSAPGVGIGREGLRIAPGLIAGQRIMLFFEKLVEPVSTIENFDRLPIPFRAVAADINTGDPLVIEGGSLALAMRASMSLPGIFPAVQIGEHVVVDGGVARNVPVDVVRDMGADIIIAIDVGTPLQTLTTQSSVLAIASQVAGLLTVGNTRAQLATLTDRDVLISPPLGNLVTTSDFSKGPEALAIGKQGVEAASAQLARLSVSEAAYAQNRSIRSGRQTTPPIVQFVRLDNRTRYRDSLLLSQVIIPLDQPLDAAGLEQVLHRSFGVGTLALASYEVVEEDGKTGVILHLREKTQGPNYVELGLSMSGNLSNRFASSFRFGVLQSPINDTGGELRYLLSLGDQSGLNVEYYQPFGPLGRYFFATRALYEGFQINEFDSTSNEIAEYEVSQAGISLGAGREFGNYGALGMYYRRFAGDAELTIGDPTLPNFNTQTGELILRADVDRLDSIFFPREGYSARVGYKISRETLGADTDFEQFDFDAIGARGFDKHAFQLGLRYHVTTSGVAPIQSVYRLGGYTRLVGYELNELSGQNYAILLGGYSYKIADIFNQDALVGGSLEYGNVWQERSDMSFSSAQVNGSLYVGLNSWIGPILFGIGAREGGEMNLFLEVGHRF